MKMKDGMVNKRTKVVYVNVFPEYNYPEEKVGEYCQKCKLDGMINIKQKNVIVENTKPNSIMFLKYHDSKDCKMKNMVDVTRKRKRDHGRRSTRIQSRII